MAHAAQQVIGLICFAPDAAAMRRRRDVRATGKPRIKTRPRARQKTAFFGIEFSLLVVGRAVGEI